MKKILFVVSLLSFVSFVSCGAYSFTGGSTGDSETVQVDFFPNNARLVEPTVSQKFTLELQDLFIRQTNLKSVRSGGDLHFEGEISQYRIIPVSATAEQTAALNRLTVAVRVRFYNKLVPDDDFEQSFSFFSDFDANAQLTGSVLEDALDEIFERITQDIFNASVAKW